MKYTIAAAALAGLAAADCPNELLTQFQSDTDGDILSGITGLNSAVSVSTTVCPSVTSACITQADYDTVGTAIATELTTQRDQIASIQSDFDGLDNQMDQLVSQLRSAGASNDQVNATETFFNVLVDAFRSMFSKMPDCYEAVFKYYVGTICLATRADWNDYATVSANNEVTITYDSSTCSDLQTGCTPLLEEMQTAFQRVQDAYPAFAEAFGLTGDDSFLPDDVLDPCGDESCDDFICDSFLAGAVAGVGAVQDSDNVSVPTSKRRREATTVDEIASALANEAKTYHYIAKVQPGALQNYAAKLHARSKSRRSSTNTFSSGGYAATTEGGNSSVDTTPPDAAGGLLPDLITATAMAIAGVLLF
eukprot:Clim_evm62s218 gene=Clim_evmTU62s218